jgi:SNF2 family DNA or RNA helicase
MQVVLKQIMLRRTKDILTDLPARTVEIVSCPFNASEKSFYESLAAQMNNALENIMMENKNTNYMSVLLLLLRLRQGVFYNRCLQICGPHEEC